MKVAIIKLGARISINSSATSGGTGEVISIIKLLIEASCSVDVYTKVLESDEVPTDFSIYNIEDFYMDINKKGYDCLLVFNGNVNYFGGVDDPAQTLNYFVINNFNGRVFYIMCDCNLLLKQIWSSVESKSWANNYHKEDLYISRDDIIYISQARFVHKVKEKASKFVNIKSVIYFPFEKFPLITLDDLEFNCNPKYDILYGGTFRGGNREDDMIKFYFGYDSAVRVSMFGKIKLDNFNSKKINNLRPPEFLPSVPYFEFPYKMLESISTIIIGDKLYKQWGDLAQRIYESIRVGNVVFIDNSYDFKKSVFSNNKDLLDFCYVSSKRDVEDRLAILQDNNFRKSVLTSQRECVNINKKDYCTEFINILKENI